MYSKHGVLYPGHRASDTREDRNHAVGEWPASEADYGPRVLTVGSAHQQIAAVALHSAQTVANKSHRLELAYLIKCLQQNT